MVLSPLLLLSLATSFIAYYKPALMLCSLNSDEERSARKGRPERSTLHQLVSDFPPLGDGYHLVGRLDRDSEGLLLLSQDGQFTATVLSGGCHKTYWALVQGDPTESALDQMRRGGLNIRGATTKPPISVTKLVLAKETLLAAPALGMDRPGTWIEIVLNEGRNRQVRRTTAAAGHATIRLVRVAIGRLRCGDLQPGEWKYIDPDDVLSA